MKAAARRRAEATLRACRLEAAYLVARLSAHTRTQPLIHGLSARAEAIDRYFARATDVEVRAARSLAEHGAYTQARFEGSDEPVEAALAGVHVAIGGLRAERTRLDARLQAELHAFSVTKKVLRIRLSRLAA